MPDFTAREHQSKQCGGENKDSLHLGASRKLPFLEGFLELTGCRLLGLFPKLFAHTFGLTRLSGTEQLRDAQNIFRKAPCIIQNVLRHEVQS
jgi:hypothetical protein